nr:hypothetical protein [Sphingomonas sp. PAMC 26605]
MRQAAKLSGGIGEIRRQFAAAANIPLAIMAAVLVILWTPKDLPRSAPFVELIRQIDFLGTVLFTAPLLSLMIFLMNLTHPIWWALLAATGLSLVLVAQAVGARHRSSRFVCSMDHRRRRDAVRFAAGHVLHGHAGCGLHPGAGPGHRHRRRPSAHRAVYRRHRHHNILGFLYGRRATDHGFHNLAIVMDLLSAVLLCGAILDHTLPRAAPNLNAGHTEVQNGYYREAPAIFGHVAGVDLRSLVRGKKAWDALGISPAEAKSIHPVAYAQLHAQRKE